MMTSEIGNFSTNQPLPLEDNNDPITVLEKKLLNLTVEPNVDIINIDSEKINLFMSYYYDFIRKEKKLESNQDSILYFNAKFYRDRILNYPIGFSSLEKTNNFIKEEENLLEKLSYRLEESDFAFGLYKFIKKYKAQAIMFNEKYDKFKELSLEDNFIKESLFVLLKERSKEEFVLKWKQNFNQDILAVAINKLQYYTFDSKIRNLIVPVPGFVKDDISKILQSGIAKNIYFIAYEHEKKNIINVQSSLKKEKTHLTKESLDCLKFLGITAYEDMKFSENQEEKHNYDDEQTQEDKYVEKVLNSKIWKKYSTDFKERRIINAQIANFNNGDMSIVLPPNGKIIQCEVINKNNKYIISNTNYIGIDSLNRGDLIIYPSNGKSDFIDFFADRNFPDLPKQRKNANLWKELFKKYYEDNFSNYEDLKASLEKYGIKREINTLKNWIWLDDTILPKNSIETFSILTKIFNNELFSNNSNQIRIDGEKVRKARREISSNLSNYINNKSLILTDEKNSIFELNLGDLKMESYLLEFNFLSEIQSLPIESLYKIQR